MAAKGNNLAQSRRAAEKVRLGDLLTPYKELNRGGGVPVVAVGRYGIRLRDEIYSKQLAKDTSKNRLIFKGTLTVGMGSKQIDIGILSENKCYAVSPAYHTYRITGVDFDYLRYCLEARNPDMSKRYMIASCRQGKTIDFDRWLDYEIPVHDERGQLLIRDALDKICELKKNAETRLEKLDLLVKSRFVEMFGDVSSTCFPLQTIGSIAKEIRYGTSRPAVEGGKYIYLRMNNVTQDGRVDLTNIKRISVPDSEVEKCIVRRGDILFNRTNSKELIGKTCMFDFDEPMIIAGYLIRVRLEEYVMPQYVSMFMNLPSMKSKLRHMAKGAVNQVNISAEELKTIKLPIPPLALQREFAAFVEKVDKLRVNVREAVAKMDMLYRSKLQEYFG